MNDTARFPKLALGTSTPSTGAAEVKDRAADAAKRRAIERRENIMDEVARKNIKRAVI
jgi:hypothetical protein